MSSHPASPYQPPLALWLQPALHRLLAQSSHALLLHGAAGLGQWALAMHLAKAWLCETRTPEQSTSATAACGHCAGCTLFDAGNHPDFQLLMPDAQRDQYGLPLRDKKKKKPSKMILTEYVRSTLEAVTTTSTRGGMQVVVIYPAQHLNAVSANTLLKTLEEPNSQVRFILATEKLHALLPTIRSRCTQFNLPWADEAQATAWLQQQLTEHAADTISTVLRAQGGRAYAALESATQLNVQQWQQLPSFMAAGNAAQLSNLLTTPAQFIDAALKVCHDWYCVQANHRTRYFPEDSFERLSAPSLEQLAALSHALHTSARSVEHTWNPDLHMGYLVSHTSHHLSGVSKPNNAPKHSSRHALRKMPA